MADPFTVIATRSFRKDLRKLPRQDQVRVRAALAVIEQNPYKGRKVAKAKIGLYRWRVGNWRIRYDIEKKNIILLRVLKRADTYRRF